MLLLPRQAISEDSARLAKISGPGMNSRLISASSGTVMRPEPSPVDACNMEPKVIMPAAATKFAKVKSIPLTDYHQARHSKPGVLRSEGCKFLRL